MKKERRRFIGTAVCAPLASALAPRRADAAPAAPPSPPVPAAPAAALPTPNSDEAVSFLSEWEALGWHWTGSDVEAASADWLGHVLSEAGARSEIETYRFMRSDIGLCSVRSDTRHIVALPLFDAGLTDAQGVSGRLGSADSDAEIALIEVAPDNPLDPTLAAARVSPKHRAVIVITTGGKPGLAPLDSRSTTRSGLPVVQVSSAERDSLRAAQAAARPVTVIAQAETSDSLARNVIAAVAGSDTERAPIVLHAGRSGWGPCTGERGGALYCAVATMRFVLTSHPARSVVLVATSGEELGGLGEAALSARYPELKAHAYGWIRLNANLGVRAGALNLESGTQEWLSQLRRELRIGAVRFSGDPEAGVPAAAEGNSLVLSQAHGPLYHLPSDQLPSACDLQQLNAMARALSRTVLTLANT